VSSIVAPPRHDLPSYLWPRPKYRGFLHAFGAMAVVPLGVTLVAVADGARATLAAAVYVVAQLVVFATSATYHLVASTPTARRRMQLADHSMIYLLIAGTWVPVCLLVLAEPLGVAFLVGLGTAAAVGIGLKLCGVHRFPRASNALYGVMGGAALLALPAIIHEIDLAALGLMALGGVVYAAGAMVLLMKRPDPRPSVFGYHEIWHGCTVAAAACHFAMVWLLVA
jgi:hemolysin III